MNLQEELGQTVGVGLWFKKKQGAICQCHESSHSFFWGAWPPLFAVRFKWSPGTHSWEQPKQIDVLTQQHVTAFSIVGNQFYFLLFPCFSVNPPKMVAKQVSGVRFVATQWCPCFFLEGGCWGGWSLQRNSPPRPPDRLKRGSARRSARRWRMWTRSSCRSSAPRRGRLRSSCNSSRDLGIWLWVKPMVAFWGRCTTHCGLFFSGDWDVHWGYGILTRGHMVVA